MYNTLSLLEEQFISLLNRTLLVISFNYQNHKCGAKHNLLTKIQQSMLFFVIQ